MFKQKQFEILIDGSINTPKGFQSGGLFCGIKKKKLDLGWIYSDVPADAAAVYTTNLFQAAPIQVTKESIGVEKKIQAVLVNSGNANACTGKPGLQDAYQMRNDFAKVKDLSEHHVAVASTGVIGELLPMDKIKAGIASISREHEDEQGENFSHSILTTDTSTKQVAVQLEVNGKTITIAGAAKGSGMIHPNMGTMLGFITTDAAVEQVDLEYALKEVTKQTFNMITVDGDTSTNDMVIVLANGLAENNKLDREHQDWASFLEALKFVSEELAKKIARDGEGATKLIEVQVNGAPSDEAAQAIAKSIVGSSLVKSAVFGTDPNWGRIVCAVGYSGVQLDPNQVKVAIGPFTVVDNGLPSKFDKKAAVKYLEQENIHIDVHLKQGQGQAIAWGCDLTYDYVKINAMYTT